MEVLQSLAPALLRRAARTWPPLVGVGLALTLGCSSLLNLDALQKSDCAEGECGGTGASAGKQSNGGDQAGSSQGGSGPGGGGNAASVGGGGSSGGASGGGSDSGGTSGSGGSDSSGGSIRTGGASGSGGAPPVAGGPAGGTSGGPGVDGCKPSATDESCDGLDKNCQETAEDTACVADCAGAFANGTSYMSCLADSDFDQAEAACQENGMHLVKIDSALENETVLGLASDDYVWVGGSNRDDFDVFSWMDGTPFYSFVAEIDGAYENFSDSEPSQDERWPCVEQDADGTWSTWDCADGQSFVCERY